MKRMTRNILTRLLSLTLCAVTVLSLFSCTPRKDHSDTDSESAQRLVVEASPAVYSEQTLQDASARIATVCAGILRLGGGPVLNVTQKQKIEEKVRVAVLPRLEEENIYEEELWELLRVAEEIVDAAERGELESSSDLLLLFRFYQSGLATVDTQKMGRTVYCLLQSWLEYQRDYSQQRYDKYGYQWYLDDAERYATYLTDLQGQLGADTFCEMTAMLMFGVSMLGGLALDSEADGAFALSDAEAVMLIRRQATFFADKQITEAQWALMASILGEWNGNDTRTVLGAQIDVLQKEGTLEELATLMPALLELYRAMADGLTEDMIREWNEGSLSFDALVGRLLVHSSEAFLEFDRAWSTLGKRESDAALASIKRMGLEEAYADFLAETPSLHAEDLIGIANECASASEEVSVGAMRDAMLGYLRVYLPCIAFAISQENE